MEEFKKRPLKKDYDYINHQVVKLLINLSNNSLRESKFDDRTILKNLKRGKGNQAKYARKPNLRDIIDITDEEEEEEDDDEDFDDSFEDEKSDLNVDILNLEKKRIKDQLKKIKQKGSQKKKLKKNSNSKKNNFFSSMKNVAYYGGLPFSLKGNI